VGYILLKFADHIQVWFKSGAITDTSHEDLCTFMWISWHV